jgi:hypothetical protein
MAMSSDAETQKIHCLEAIRQWRERVDKEDEENAMICVKERCIPTPPFFPDFCWCSEKQVDNEKLERSRKRADDLEEIKKKKCEDEYNARKKAEGAKNAKSF